MAKAIAGDGAASGGAEGKVTMGRVSTIAALALSVALAWPLAVHARERANLHRSDEIPANVIEVGTGSATSQIVVPLDKSQAVHFDRAFTDIDVGSRDTIAVIPLSPTTAVIVGKKRGTTNMTLSDGGHVVAVVDVVVTYDIEGLQRRIHDLMPNEHIDIQPAGDTLVLSGHVSSSDHLRQIEVLASGYAPKEKVTDLLSIGGSQQVLLEVRFTEISRNALKDLGVNSKLTVTAGTGNSLSSTTGTGVNPTAFGVLSGIFTSGNYALQVEIDALEQKGLLRTLAEPNLVALSGQTASFLAGGEFPIPVAQGLGTGTNVGTGAITIEFKDFGVGLGFTPTVTGKDLINLAIASEVSSIDPTLSVEENGINIPALKVRRAKTAVELHDGESFAIAGLMQDDFQDAISQVPGLGSLPIIGPLFRSTNFQRNQTELAVFITVHLVQPSVRKDLADPTDTTKPPSDVDLFGNGQTQSLAAPNSSSALPHGDVLP